MGFKYQYALTSVPFDSSYENAIRFDSRAQQEEYFKVSTLFVNAPSVDFDFGALNKTTVVIKAEGSPLTVMGSNYFILKNTNENAGLKYIYYFVDQVEYITGGNDESKSFIQLDLTLDVLNTYLLEVDLSQLVLIKRAHVDRWGSSLIINGETNYPFNTDLSTNEGSIFFQQDLNVSDAKVVKDREALDYNIGRGSNTEALQWLRDNVLYWEYIFLNADTNFKYYDADTKSYEEAPHIDNSMLDFVPHNMKSINDGRVDIGYSWCCVPVYKTDKKIICRQYAASGQYLSIEVGIPFNKVNKLFENGSAGIIGIKISPFPPAPVNCNIASVDSDGNLILPVKLFWNHATNGKCASAIGDFFYGYHFTSYVNTNNYASIIGNPGTFRLPLNLYYSQFKVQYDFSKFYRINNVYSLNHIKEYNDIDMCPVLYNKSFREIAVQYMGDEITYAPLDLFDYNEKIGYVDFLIEEPIQPEITRTYIRVEGPQGIYSRFTNNNLSGMVVTNDTSLAVSNSAINEFMANNKNFWMQSLASAIGGTSLYSLYDAYTPATESKPGRPAVAPEVVGYYTNTQQKYKTYSRNYKQYKAGDKRLVQQRDFTHALVTPGRSAIPATPGTPASYDWGSVIKLGINVASSLAESALILDNVKASPGTIKGSSSSTVFNMATYDFKTYLEYRLVPEGVLKKYFDYYYQYGYLVDRMGKVEDYINIRHYFNYIKADLQNITSKGTVGIPNQVRDEIKSIFADGIRFWNVTDKMFDYNVSNYERRFD